jgi:hypothetical protein
MLMTAAVSLSLLGHLPSPAPVYKVGPWLIEANADRFTGTVGCELRTRDARLQRDTLIFRVAPGGDTTAAVFRVDSGRARSIAEAFDAVEARGLFPQRGWLVDPNGGEAALPVSYVSGATAVWIRVWPRRPRRFDVSRLAEAETAARAQGCHI